MPGPRTTPGPAALCAAKHKQTHDWLKCKFGHLADDPALQATALLMQRVAILLNEELDDPKRRRWGPGRHSGRDLIAAAGVGHSSLNNVRYGRSFVNVLVLNRLLWALDGELRDQVPRL